MNLEEKINGDIKEAMLKKDKKSLDALRAIKSAFLLLKTEKGAGELTDDLAIKTLQKLAKQRKESAELYKSQNREDLYAEEMSQLSVISQYLPEQLSPEAIKTELKKLMAAENITDIKGMGKLMGLASKTFTGKADNKIVSEIVKELLTQK